MGLPTAQAFYLQSMTADLKGAVSSDLLTSAYVKAWSAAYAQALGVK